MSARIRLVAPLAALLAAWLAAGASAQPADSKALLEIAADAVHHAEHGAYGQAADRLRQLRKRVAPDADLELALAIYEARAGENDSARTRLGIPLLTRALGDTLPISRRQGTSWHPEATWINGRFDGWSWYIARARAEVAVRERRWSDALLAARQAVQARPLAGKEWLILAIAAAHAGALEEAEGASRRALYLDASLPEAHYLDGLWSWRGGRRAAAQKSFRQAMAIDSAYRAPAQALVRSRLPSATPEAFPLELLTGVREAGLLTSPIRPKMEEFMQMEVSAQLLKQVDPALPDSLVGSFTAARLSLTILVDERGHVVLHDLPWFDPKLLPEQVVSLTLESLPEWRFVPARRLGAPTAVWSGIQLTIEP